MKQQKQSVFSHLTVVNVNKVTKVKKKKALILVLLFIAIFSFGFFVSNTYIWPVANSESASWDQCWERYYEKEHNYNVEPTDPCGLPPRSSSGQIFINYNLLNILLPITLASISVTIVNKKYFK